MARPAELTAEGLQALGGVREGRREDDLASMVTTVSNISLKTARDEYSRGQFVFPKVPASDGDDLNLLTPWRDDDKRGQPFAGQEAHDPVPSGRPAGRCRGCPAGRVRPE